MVSVDIKTVQKTKFEIEFTFRVEILSFINIHVNKRKKKHFRVLHSTIRWIRHTQKSKLRNWQINNRIINCWRNNAATENLNTSPFYSSHIIIFNMTRRIKEKTQQLSIHCSCRGCESNSQDPHNVSQLSVTPVHRISTPYSGLIQQHTYVLHMDTCQPNIHIHKNNKPKVTWTTFY